MGTRRRLDAPADLALHSPVGGSHEGSSPSGEDDGDQHDRLHPQQCLFQSRERRLHRRAQGIRSGIHSRPDGRGQGRRGRVRGQLGWQHVCHLGSHQELRPRPVIRNDRLHRVRSFSRARTPGRRSLNRAIRSAGANLASDDMGRLE